MKQLIFILMLFVSYSIYSQTEVIGKVYTTEFAKAEFGLALDKAKINTESLLKYCDEAGDYIYITVKGGSLKVLDEKGLDLLGTRLSEEEVYYKASTSKVREVIEKGDVITTTINLLNGTASIENGAYTLQSLLGCPPNCNP